MRRIRWFGLALVAATAAGCGAQQDDGNTVVRHFDGRPALDEAWSGPPLAPSEVSATSSMATSEQVGSLEKTEVTLLEPALSWADQRLRPVQSSVWVVTAAVPTTSPAFVGVNLDQVGNGQQEEESVQSCSSDRVFACKAAFVPVVDDTVYTCLDATGSPLFFGAARELVASGVCTEEELRELADAYEQETCVRQVSSSQLPDSLIVDAFVREDAIAESVCSNVDSTRFEWMVDDTALVYQRSYRFDEQGEAVDSWMLEMESYHPSALETHWYPHLLCESFETHGDGIGLWVNWSDSALVIEVGVDAAQPGVSIDEDAFLDQLTSSEVSCQFAPATEGGL